MTKIPITTYICLNKALAEHSRSIDEEGWKAIQERDDEDKIDVD